MGKKIHTDTYLHEEKRIPTHRRLIVQSALYGLCAFALYGSQVLAPLHVPIALYFLYRMYKKLKLLYGRLYTKKIQHVAQRTWKHIVLYKVALGVLMTLLFCWYAYVSLIPTDADVFTRRSHDEVAQVVETDLVRAAQFVDMLTVTGEKLLKNVALYKSELTPEEQESLRRDWDAFLGVAIASEEVTEVHRYFSQIPIFNETDLHAQSFTISYALYMKKFEYFHKIISAVNTHTVVRTVLNEYSRAFGASDSYTDVTDRYFATNSLL